MNKELLKRIVYGLPEEERRRPVVFIDGKLYNWNEILNEFEKNENSEICKKILKKIEEITK